MHRAGKNLPYVPTVCTKRSRAYHTYTRTAGNDRTRKHNRQSATKENRAAHKVVDCTTIWIRRGEEFSLAIFILWSNLLLRVVVRQITFYIMSLNSTFSGFHHHLMMATAWIATVAADEGMSGGGTAGTKHIRRKRIPVRQLFRNLGARYVKKAYRMNVRTFRVYWRV